MISDRRRRRLAPDAPSTTADGAPASSPVAAPREPRWRRLLATPTPVIFAASLVVAAVLLWRQGTLGDLGATARDADPVVIAAGLVLYLVGLAILCLRWYALTRMAGGEADPPRAAEAFLTSVVVNYAAPIGLAVPTRAALSARDLGLTAGAGGAVALWEIALDVVVLAAIGVAWLISSDGAALGRLEAPGRGMILLGVGIGAGAGALLMVAAARWPALRRRLAVAARDLVRYPGRRPRPALAAFGLTVGFWALQAIILGLMLAAVGLWRTGGWEIVLGLLGWPVLVGMLSPVPGGAGVREALMVAVAQARGLDGAAVLLAAVAYRAALFLTIPVLYLAVRVWRGRRDGRGRSRAGNSDG